MINLTTISLFGIFILFASGFAFFLYFQWKRLLEQKTKIETTNKFLEDVLNEQEKVRKKLETIETKQNEIIFERDNQQKILDVKLDNILNTITSDKPTKSSKVLVDVITKLKDINK